MSIPEGSIIHDYLNPFPLLPVRLLHMHVLALDLRTAHRLQYNVRMLSRHLDECVIIEHIDTSDHTSRPAGFSGDRTEDIARTDALVLSDVDEETRYILISATASSAVSSTTAAAALILKILQLTQRAVLL